MLTPDMIRAMTPEQRGQLFHKMAKEFYGTERYIKKLCDDFDIGKTSAYRFTETGPPFAILLALDAWLDQGSADLRELRHLPTQLAETAQKLAAAATAASRAAGTMSRAARSLVTPASLSAGTKPAAPEAEEA